MTGEDLKKLREKAGYSQEQLALELGITRFTVMNHESGKTKISKPNARVYESLLNPSTDISQIDGDRLTGKHVDLSSVQASHLSLVNASTSSASLELICEILAEVTKEPLDQVKARARALTVVKSRNVEKFLKTLI